MREAGQTAENGQGPVRPKDRDDSGKVTILVEETKQETESGNSCGNERLENSEYDNSRHFWTEQGRGGLNVTQAVNLPYLSKTDC